MPAPAPDEIPLRFIHVGTILGDQEGMESLALSSAFSSGGSHNLYIDKFASVSSILGYIKTNAVAVTSNTDAHPMAVRAFCHYIRTPAGVTTRQQIAVFDDGVANYEFRYSNDVGISWTYVYNFGGGVVNLIPDFAQQGNTLVMTNAAIRPQTWDGTTLADAGGIQLAAPAITDAGSGLLNGNYRWRVVPIRDDGSRKLSSVTSDVTPLANRKATVDWVADADITVIGYEVYRTTGSGAIFYYEGVTDTRLVVTFTSNTDDLDLIGNRALEEYGDAPPVAARFCEAHGARMWYGGTPDKPRAWYYSDNGLPESVYTAFNFIDMTDAESASDQSTGGTGNFQGMFVAWMERSVWTVSGTGQVNGAVVDYDRRRTNAQAGTVSHRTVVRIPAGSVYTNQRGEFVTTGQVTLAYLTPYGDIRLFDGDNDTIISTPKKDFLATLRYAYRAKSFAIHDTVRGEVTWVVTTASSATGTCDAAITWNYRFGVWYSRDWAFGHGMAFETDTEANVILAGEGRVDIGGYVYKLWDGYAFDEFDPIPAVFETKTFYGTGTMQEPSLSGAPLLSFTKRWRWIDLLFETTLTMDVLVEWLPEESLDGQEPGSSTVVVIRDSSLVTSDGSAIESSDGVAIVVGMNPTRVRIRLVTTNDADPMKNGRYLHSRGVRIRISSSSDFAAFKIIGFNVAYQLLDGLKRD